MNIPIYRAKWLYKDNITSKEYINGYVIGFYFEYLGKHYIRTNNSEPFAVEIDPTTLAIHFPDMLDNQGNKIFASLQEDGKGGDVCEAKWFKIDEGLTVKTGSVRYSNMGMIQAGYNISRYEYIKVVGIHQ